MKKILYVLPILIFSFFINANAQTKLILEGKENIDYGKTINYNVILKTDEDINGFQFDLNLDSNLSFLSYKSNIDGLIVKVSNDKTKIIGYGKTLTNNDNLLTIVFNTKELDKTTTVNTKVKNDIYVSLNNTKISGEGSSVSTKVIVPVKEEEKLADNTSTNTTSITDSKIVDTTKDDEKKEVEIKDDTKKDETKEEGKISKIIKIIIIILLGIFILYLLNKETIDEETVQEEVKKEKK